MTLHPLAPKASPHDACHRHHLGRGLPVVLRRQASGGGRTQTLSRARRRGAEAHLASVPAEPRHASRRRRPRRIRQAQVRRRARGAGLRPHHRGRQGGRHSLRFCEGDAPAQYARRAQPDRARHRCGEAGRRGGSFFPRLLSRGQGPDFRRNARRDRGRRGARRGRREGFSRQRRRACAHRGGGQAGARDRRRGRALFHLQPPARRFRRAGARGAARSDARGGERARAFRGGVKPRSPMDRPPAKAFTVSFHPRAGDRALARRLSREIEGEVLFDAASRGRYSTDASIYQIDPVGVVVPRTERDGASAVVQPGVVLDTLNAYLRSHALWFPVDVSTSAQATIGGMAGNNSCGSRSIRYGNMVHNVLGIDALLADGAEYHFGAVPEDLSRLAGPRSYVGLAQKIRAVAEREAGEIEARWPKVLRRVQGYNLDTVVPRGAWNFAQLLVGSEGTLAFSKRIHLKLSPLPKARTLGVCHFATFRRAMEAPQHIVKLAPTAVELVDRTMIGLARGNAAFRATVEQFIRGDPDAILLVEFAGEGLDEQSRKLKELTELMADLGHPGSVVEITDAGLQREVWEVRKAGLNIMMSMKGDGKPVSFIEDCAVPLENLAEYTDLLTQVFRKHGTEGTWYAHASVGTLHVRPILNMKED